MYGLKDRDVDYIIKALSKFKEIEEGIIFGSRALGNYKTGSDIDLALKGRNIDKKILLEVVDYLNEVYPIPFFFNVLIYNQIENQNLKKHIDDEGKYIYRMKL